MVWTMGSTPSLFMSVHLPRPNTAQPSRETPESQTNDQQSLPPSVCLKAVSTVYPSPITAQSQLRTQCSLAGASSCQWNRARNGGAAGTPAQTQSGPHIKSCGQS